MAFAPQSHPAAWPDVSLQTQSFLGCMRKSWCGLWLPRPQSPTTHGIVGNFLSLTFLREARRSYYFQDESPGSWEMAISAGTMHPSDAKLTQHWCDNSLKGAIAADQAPAGQSNLRNGCTQLIAMDSAVIFLGMLVENRFSLFSMHPYTESLEEDSGPMCFWKTER